MIIHLDFETYSECDLKECGAWVYSRHPSTEVLCMAYAINEGHPVLWTPGMSLPIIALESIINMATYKAWNTFFEYCIWYNTLKWPVIPIQNWDNTQAHAMASALPRALGDCAEVLGLAVDKQKDKRGKYLIQKLCKPYRGRRIQDKALLDELYDYCKQDVVVERTLSAILTPKTSITQTERKLWEVDFKMNIQGLPIDTQLVNAAIDLYHQEFSRLKTRLEKITQLANPNSNKQFLDWLHNQSVFVDNTQATTLKVLLAEDLPEQVKEAITLRLQTAKTPVAKYETIANRTSSDNRLRGFQLYHAATTGRFSSTGVNFQNLPRPTIEDVDDCITLMRNYQHDELRSKHIDIMEVLSSSIRGVIQAPEGKMFYLADYSAIEARVLAWLAGQDDALEIFRTHGKIYEQAAANIYRVELDEVTKPQRTVGKVSCIAEDELVLTSVGLIPIQNVTHKHKVWDGLSWVSCDGAIYKGEKEVITYEGLTATTDHIVFTKQGWEVPFGTCAREQIAIAKTGSGWQAIRLGQDNLTQSYLETSPKKMGFYARFKSLLCRLWGAKIHINVQSFVGQNQRLPDMFTKKKDTKMAVQKSFINEAKMSKSKRSELETLWRTWDRISFFFSARRLLVDSGEFRVTKESGTRSNRQQWSLHTWKSKICKSKSKCTQYPSETTHPSSNRLSNKVSRYKICKQHLEKFIKQAINVRRDSTKVLSEIIKTKRRVWDILNAGPNNRFTVSNLLVHNCLALGYQGGYRAFQKMATIYNVDISDNDAKEIVAKWRRSNHAITGYWELCNNAAIQAIHKPFTTYEANLILFRSDGNQLWAKLPSGRKLTWNKPCVVDGQLGYKGVEPTSGKWVSFTTYGGDIVQSLTQAVARDVMANAMLALDAEGFELRLTVHDEIVVETERPFDEFMKIMNTPPAWAKGLPIKAEGEICTRYKK